MAAVQHQRFRPCAPGDVLAILLDDLIRRGGGPGNLGQLRLRLGYALTGDQCRRLADRWPFITRSLPLLAARIERGLAGFRWRLATHPVRGVEFTDVYPDAIGDRQLREGMEPARGDLLRLTIAGGSEPGLVLTWHHALCDVRGALGFLAQLPTWVEGATPRDPWWRPEHRWATPADAAQRGRLAGRLLGLLKPVRRRPFWQPLDDTTAGPSRLAAVPLSYQFLHFTREETARIDARQRDNTGRFAPAAHLLSVLAAALVSRRSGAGDLVLPLAVDLRSRQDTRLLANLHGLLQLRLPAAVAADPRSAGPQLVQEHRRWLAGQGPAVLMSALSWFPWVPGPWRRRELGHGRPGLAASCLCAVTGEAPLGGHWWNLPIVDLDHLVTVPANPGLAALFHRAQDRLGVSLIAAPAVARALDLAALAVELRGRLLGEEWRSG